MKIITSIALFFVISFSLLSYAYDDFNNSEEFHDVYCESLNDKTRSNHFKVREFNIYQTQIVMYTDKNEIINYIGAYCKIKLNPNLLDEREIVNFIKYKDINYGSMKCSNVFKEEIGTGRGIHYDFKMEKLDFFVLEYGENNYTIKWIARTPERDIYIYLNPKCIILN